VTTAAGRLFDAAAALTGLRLEASFEGQGPMELEAAWQPDTGADIPSLPVTSRDGLWEVDWAPLLAPLRDRSLSIGARSALLHGALAGATADLAAAVARERPVDRVGLTGGVFQNRVLTERAVAALEGRGFRPCLHRELPPNDGAIALGQVVEVAADQ
jgi:hydrogenase maturation protein HypF